MKKGESSKIPSLSNLVSLLSKAKPVEAHVSEAGPSHENADLNDSVILTSSPNSEHVSYGKRTSMSQKQKRHPSESPPRIDTKKVRNDNPHVENDSTPGIEQESSTNLPPNTNSATNSKVNCSFLSQTLT